MIHLGLIGFQVAHSLSPQLHQAALVACGLPGEYHLYPVPPLPAGRSKLDELLHFVRDGSINGLNVTIPHKQNVVDRLDELTPAARAIGAVNTIYMRDEELVGDNTDAPGFLGDLQRQLAASSLAVTARPGALILGAGGSARAVAYALSKSGWDITVAARREEQARELVRTIGMHVKSDLPVVGLDGVGLQKRIISDPGLKLIVNTTPLGMAPHVQGNPWPEHVPFPDGVLVYDLVYNPRETALVKVARAAGIPAFSGLGMLVEQAALSFECWIGLVAPRLEMARAVNHEIR